MRRVVFIAGPYAAGIPDEIDANVERACTLARFAVKLGMSPIVPHAAGRLGIFGGWREDSEETREAALESGAALAALVGAGGGTLWVLLCPDGTRSPGVRREVLAWTVASSSAERPGRRIARTWSEWRKDMGRDVRAVLLSEVIRG